MPTHHRITLVVREEPEGHGTLFLDRGDNDPRALEAVAIIPRYQMEEDPRDFANRLANTISTHLPRVTDAMMETTCDGPLLPIGQAAFSEAMESITAERSAVLMQFISWMSNNDCAEMEEHELLNAFAEDTHVEFPTYSVVLSYFATWVDNHPKWRMTRSDSDIPQRTSGAVKEYLEKVNQYDGEWNV